MAFQDPERKLDEEVYMNTPQGSGMRDGVVWTLEKTLCGRSRPAANRAGKCAPRLFKSLGLPATQRRPQCYRPPSRRYSSHCPVYVVDVLAVPAVIGLNRKLKPGDHGEACWILAMAIPRRRNMPPSHSTECPSADLFAQHRHRTLSLSVHGFLPLKS